MNSDVVREYIWDCHECHHQTVIEGFYMPDGWSHYFTHDKRGVEYMVFRCPDCTAKQNGVVDDRTS